MQQGMDDDLYNQVQSYVTNDAFTPREKLAIEYAEQFAVDHTMVDDDLWRRLGEHFSPQEVMELTMTNAFCVGFGRAFQVLDVDSDIDINWTREPQLSRAP